jgi:tetratricopeptide (TPR) repeat protein
VIARNSSGVYRGTPADVREVGADLNVGYVLEGSIQRQADRVRVTAQLINARTGAHAWSERWDRPATDVLAVQTELAERVASTLGGYGLLTSEGRAAAKRKRPVDLAAYDLWALAYEALMRGKEADLDQALVYADAAIAEDPGLVRAYTRKAWIRLVRAKFKNDWMDAISDMERLARLAISIDPYDAEAHAILAFTSTSTGQMAEAKAATARALELNPSSADILNQAAINMSYLGEPERGAELCDRSFQLNPSPPYWYYVACPENYFFTRRYTDAVDIVDRYRAHTEIIDIFLVYRAASLAELGRNEAAAAAVEELQQRDPATSLENVLNSNTFARDQEMQQLLASARKAGVRVCATEEELQAFASARRLPECAPKPTG